MVIQPFFMLNRKSVRGKILDYVVSKSPERLSANEILDRFILELDYYETVEHLEKLVSNALIKTQNISLPSGIKTVYFYEG
jgi:hypothetical protein